MSPIKIVVIAILIYMGYRLFVSDWNKKKNNEEEISGGSDAANEKVEDVLVEDPVCHKLVPKKQAIRYKYKGKQGFLYFCSEECCNQFVSQTGEQE